MTDNIARILALIAQGGGGSQGTMDYEDLDNKPSLGGVTIVGDMNFGDLHLNAMWVGTSAQYEIDKNTIEDGTLVFITDSNDVDSTPTQNSTKLVTSGGVYAFVVNNTLPSSTKYVANSTLTMNGTSFVCTLTLKDQNGDTIGTPQNIDLPLEAMVIGASYDDNTKSLILTLKSGETLTISIGDLVRGLQTEITINSKLSSDLVDDTNATNLFVTSSEKTTWNGKQNALSFDSVPTDGSTNPVESNGIYDALAEKLPASTKYGSSIEATPIATAQSQKMNLTLKDQDGNALDTTSFDLPIKDITVNTANNGLNLIYQGGLSKLLYITELISGKVDKIQGKGLSTEDFTAMYKAWLDVSMLSPTNHNGIFRGKDLTNIYTINEMYDMINAGTFDDLFLGDYFTKSITTDIMTRFTGETFDSGTTYYEMGGGTDVTARTWTETEDTTPQSGKTYATKETKTENITLMFAAFDYYYNVGDTSLTTPHAILLPQNAGFATAAKMNFTNTTVGGYLNSDIHQITLPCYAKSLKSALNNHVLSHRTLLSNAINASTPSMAGAGFTGASSSWEWATVELQLMTEQQVYGTRAWTSSAYDVGVDYRKLPIFDFTNPVQYSRATFWLRSVASSMYFAACATYSDATISSASSASFVRPMIVFG